MNPDLDPTLDPTSFFIDIILFCRYYFSPLHTFMRKKKDLEMDPEPDPYLCLMDPDPGGPKTSGSGSGSGPTTLLFTKCTLTVKCQGHKIDFNYLEKSENMKPILSIA
jgi:hypothetical protein